MGIDQQRAQQLQQAGVTLAGAQKAYQNIAANRVGDQSIAARFGTTFDQTTEENDALLGDAAAGQKRQTLYDSEQALFHGKGAFTGSDLGVSQNFSQTS
jgi:hypothetical protein